MARGRVFLEVGIGRRLGGRMVFELYDDTTPKTAQNFRLLCTGELGVSNRYSAPIHYLGCKFFRIIPGQIAQCGDFVTNNGQTNESAHGGQFFDESLSDRHSHAGLLGMANTGRHSNGSQFYITLQKAPHLDGKHVIFGRLVEGIDVLRAIEKVPCDGCGVPKVPVAIKGCGIVHTLPGTRGIMAEQKRDYDKLMEEVSFLNEGQFDDDPEAEWDMRKKRQRAIQASIQASAAHKVATLYEKIEASYLLRKGQDGPQLASSPTPAIIHEPKVAPNTRREAQMSRRQDEGELESKAALGEFETRGGSGDRDATDQGEVPRGRSQASAENRGDTSKMKSHPAAGALATFAVPQEIDAVASHRPYPLSASPEVEHDDIEKTNADVKLSAAEDKLAALQLKRNQCRNLNRRAAAGEVMRFADPKKEWRQARHVDRPDPPAERIAALPYCAQQPAYALTETIRKLDEKGESFGWNVFNVEATYRAHEKRVKGAPVLDEEYARQKAKLGDFFYEPTGLVDYHQPTEAQKERVVRLIDKASAKRAEFSRRRPVFEGEDITYVNERNRKFNKKLDRAFGSYSNEIKFNLERGTAF